MKKIGNQQYIYQEYIEKNKFNYFLSEDVQVYLRTKLHFNDKQKYILTSVRVQTKFKLRSLLQTMELCDNVLVAEHYICFFFLVVG